MTRVAALLLFGAVAGIGSSSASAQTDPRLVAAVRDAQEGRADTARAAVRQLLAATAVADALYPQLLYTVALTAADATERERALQRIVVEYPVSPWTDDALLLLAQSDYAGGNLPGTVRDLERIRNDFAESPVLARASVWAARTYFEMRNQSAACRWVALGLARASDDVESRDQLAFQAQRCGKLPEVAAAPSRSQAPASQPRAEPPLPVDTPTARTPDPAPAIAPVARPEAAQPVPVSTPVSAPYRIQLAAAGSQAEADAIVRGL
ncbi:MAG: hypothetical protein ABI637_10860, partial [Gemmatimonadota bacterium]